MSVVIAPLAPGCDLTVVIPAKNEARYLGRTLTALAEQRSLGRAALAPHAFDILVYANDCSDRTADVARAFAVQHACLPVHVVEADLPPDAAHVGTARRAALDLAVARFLRAGRPLGVVATTDADTIVADDWIAWTVDEMRRADAVAGDVSVSADELGMLSDSLRREYALERAYRRAFADVLVHFDPVPEDPGPRHASFVGASFAVTARAYEAAGGCPAISPLEDQAFERALRRVDARIRHSLRVRATTSARRATRVSGGFGTFLHYLGESREIGQPFVVEHPHKTVDEARLRGALRKVWAGATNSAAGEIPEHLSASWLHLIDRTQSFGANAERIIHHGPVRAYRDQPVEFALAELRRALADSTAFAATRSSAASGAG